MLINRIESMVLGHQRKLGKGARGPEVKALQRSLVQWMPSWRGKLACDGAYGDDTAAALAVFKSAYGTGVDGNSLDPRTAHALATYRSERRPLANAVVYEKARKWGFPFDQEHQVREAARLTPRRLVECDDHEMQAATAGRWLDFKELLRSSAPGYRAVVTATTDGTHSSSAHGEGRAIDCVFVDELGCPIAPSSSSFFAGLAERAGFEVLDEYQTRSTFWTGPHLHLVGP